MQPVFADPRTDFVFKRIFGANGHKSLLIALLDHLLELDGERRILDVQHLSWEQRVAIPELRLSIIDVMCTDASGRRFVVKMQVLNVEGFEKPVVYNAGTAYVMQLRTAGEYPALCDVVGVTICNFHLWPERGDGGSYKVPMLSRWRMEEQHGGERGLPPVQHAFLELPKYTVGDAPRAPIDRWAYFFREVKNLSVVPPALSEDPFRGALEVARSETFSPQEWDAYQRAKMAEQDARGALAVARQEGAEEGRKLALAKLRAREDHQEILMRVLARKALVLTQEQRDQIATCTDLATLDRWFDNALAARAVADVFSVMRSA